MENNHENRSTFQFTILIVNDSLSIVHHYHVMQPMYAIAIWRIVVINISETLMHNSY